MERLDSNDYLKGIVSNLPDCPGIYQYLNDEGTIIYVGKAKNLKRRVYSYFTKEQQSAKTRILVSKIADIRYIVVKTEADALLLENNLIKKYKPRYNVLLKDDKSYPSICVSNEYFPRIFRTRKIIRNGSTYFGQWKSNKQEGRGKYTWSNGNTYEGQWKNGLMDGEGVLREAEGDKFKGYFKEGMKEGHGVLEDKNGVRYEGEFHRDMKDGNFIVRENNQSRKVTYTHDVEQ